MKQLNEHQRAWIEALRSGKYYRTTGRLKDPELREFCCLGVFCDIQEDVFWKKNEPVNAAGDCLNYPSEFGSGYQGGYMNPDLAARIDLSYRDQRTLAQANDNAIGPGFGEVIPLVLQIYRNKGYDVSEFGELLKSRFSPDELTVSS